MNCDRGCYSNLWRFRWRVIWVAAFVLCDLSGTESFAEAPNKQRLFSSSTENYSSRIPSPFPALSKLTGGSIGSATAAASSLASRSKPAGLPTYPKYRMPQPALFDATINFNDLGPKLPIPMKLLERFTVRPIGKEIECDTNLPLMADQSVISNPKDNESRTPTEHGAQGYETLDVKGEPASSMAPSPLLEDGTSPASSKRSPLEIVPLTGQDEPGAAERGIGTKPKTPATPSACNVTEFRIAIDVGHTEKTYGAISARNKTEFTFNLRLANELLQKLQSAGFTKSEVLVQPDNNLQRRAQALNGRKPNLMLSLHHDSVQDQFLQKGELEGQIRTFTTYARGYSIFLSRDNFYLEDSKQFARMLGQEMRKQGLKPTMHHAEKIAGENRPIYDGEAGVFFYDGLVILRQMNAPAALLESAVISEPDDERRAEDPAYRARVINAILAATSGFCEAVRPTGGETLTRRKRR